MSSNLEELVQTYLTIRTEREKILSAYETQDKAFKDELNVLEQSMLAICNDTNADSIKTQNGTVIRKMNERFYCNDWDNFKKFVLEHQAVELFERRIHQGNFKEFMSEHKDDGLPPGVNVMREFGITVRKPVAR
tara:strand:+ start:1776 stop:2177 length:402 start_codon:yes stop_codon:yes gene_type:complete